MGLFDFIKSKPDSSDKVPASWHQQQSLAPHDELSEAIRQLAIAGQALTRIDDEVDDDDIFLTKRFTRGHELAGLVDAADRRVKELFSKYSAMKVDLLCYRCMRHAANLNNVITVNDFDILAELIKKDMALLRISEPKSYRKVRSLYMESFMVGIAKQKDGGWIVPNYALPLRPELIFDQF